MFATLLGPLPRPPLPDDAAAEAVLDAVLALQVEHGLEPLTAAGFGPAARDPVATWRAATALQPDHLVKAVVGVPITTGVDAAVARTQLLSLAEAGCRWIEIHEPSASTVRDGAGRARFAEVHRTLTAGLEGVHLSLAIVGGSADALGIGAALAGAYSSLAVDLIDGPDNWRLVAAAPADVGVVAGAMSTRAGSDDGPELLLWAAGYAASTGGRGPDRVGLATAGSLGHLPWDVAARKVERLGAAARLAQAGPDEVRAAVDPRALDSRSAALGRYTTPPPRRRRTTIDR